MADLSVILSILEKRHILIPIETLMNYNANKVGIVEKTDIHRDVTL